MITTGLSRNIGRDEDTYKVEQKHLDWGGIGRLITTGLSKDTGRDEDTFKVEKKNLEGGATLVPTGRSKNV